MKQLFFVCCLIFVSFFAFGQENQNKNIIQQWQEIIEKSNDWEGHKIIPKEILLQIFKNTQDTLKFQKITLTKNTDFLKKQQDSILFLQQELQKINIEYLNLQKGKNTILFFGYSLNKQHYFYVLWSIIFILGLLLAGVIFLFIRAKIITKQSVKIKNELDNEFKEYRASVIEKEKRFFQQLQDQAYKRNTQ